MIKWTRKTSKVVLMSGSVLLAACSGNQSSSNPPETVPTVTTLPTTTTTLTAQPEESTSTTAVPTTESTTTTTEPILCPGYNHPLHHLTCEEAAERTAVRKAPVVAAPAAPKPTITASAPIQGGGEVLRACIAHYESTSGLHPNIYQFESGTWQSYGGKGSASNASYEEQTRIFWLAWEDDGRHHWAAQKGRCF